MSRRGDDRYWHGPFYYNPEDSSVLVRKRFGIGWTVNFAQPLAWLFLMAVVAVPVAIVIWVAARR